MTVKTELKAWGAALFSEANEWGNAGRKCAEDWTVSAVQVAGELATGVKPSDKTIRNQITIRYVNPYKK